MIGYSVIPLLFFVSFAVLRSSDGDVVKVLKCPCALSVSRQVSAQTKDETFDVLVSHVASMHKTHPFYKKGFLKANSLRNVRVSDAIRTESGRHVFREMRINDKGIFRINIRHHSTRAVEENPSYDLDLHASARQVVCPVVLAPDPPLVTIARMSSADKLPEMVRSNGTNDPRIVGGLFISPTLLPYLVGIQISPTGGRCTGTLLSERWIMTAAHCEVQVGSTVLVATRSTFEGPTTTVTRVFTHPRYNTVSGNRRNFFDITVAELSADVSACTACDVAPQFMPINFDTSLPQPVAFMRVAGFGVTSDDGSVPEPEPGLLRQVDVPAVDTDTCRSIYGVISSRNQQVCAGYLEDGDCDSCFGDSGGPLVQYAGTTPVLMGVTSFGIGCARPGFPGVYTNPAGHKAWLESTPAIFTANSRTIRQVFRNCQRGFFLPFVEDSISRCVQCPRNSISSGGTVRECQRCPSNRLRDTRRGDRCSCRARRGFGSVAGQIRCRRCRRGTASAFGQPRCIRCPVNTYAPDRGMARCLPCPGAPRGATVCDTTAT